MDKPNFLGRSATGAKTALAVLRAELQDTSASVGEALALIERLIAEVEALRHPLFMREEAPRVRWPLRPHWDRWVAALEQLADASGAQVECSQKWNRARVTLGAGRNANLTMALAEIGDFVEVASDMDGSETREALRSQVPIRQSDGHSPYIALADIPQAWRVEFARFLRGSGAPLVEGAGQCAWPVDWERWLEADWRDGWRMELPLTVRDMLDALRGLPPDMPVMLPAESGIDYALSVRVAEVARHSYDWESTPVGQYRELPDDETAGQSFRVVLIDLEPRQT